MARDAVFVVRSDGDVIGTKAPATTDGNDDIDAGSSGHAPSAPDDTSIQHPRCRCGCDADIITTKSKETFTDLCNRLHLPADQHVLYHEYLQEQHNYGHRRHAGSPGYHFPNPFNKKSKLSSRQFPADIPFPVPTGAAWQTLVSAVFDRHVERSNQNNMEFCVKDMLEEELGCAFAGVQFDRFLCNHTLDDEISEPVHTAGISLCVLPNSDPDNFQPVHSRQYGNRRRTQADICAVDSNFVPPVLPREIWCDKLKLILRDAHTRRIIDPTS